MTETNLQDIANKLQSLERGILMLKDCYVVLHNDLITRKVDPERSIIAYLNQVKDVVAGIVNECDTIKYTMLKERDRFKSEQQGCFKWIASHIEEIEKKLEALISNPEKKLRVKVYFEGEKERALEEEGDLTHKNELEKVFELLMNQSLGDKMVHVMKNRWNNKGKKVSFAIICNDLNLSRNRAYQIFYRSLRLIWSFHKHRKIDIYRLPEGPMKDALLDYSKEYCI